MWRLLALIATPAAAEEPVGDYRDHLDQARFFLKRGWNADAAEQLEYAVAHPDGRLDPEPWFMLAKVRFELADLEGARHAAERALTMSRDEDQANQSRELLAFLDQRFGTVELLSPRAGVATRIELELSGVLMDPVLKAWFNEVQARLSERTDLPVIVGLPAGSYVVQGTPVDVTAAQTVQVTLQARQVGLQTLELSLSPGVSSWGGDLRSVLPSPGAELSIALPIGPIYTALRGGAAAHPRETIDGGIQFDPGWSAALDVGLEDQSEDPLVIRGGAGLRRFALVGPRAVCVEEQCTVEYARPPLKEGVEVYDLPGQAWAPGLWLSAGYLDRRRASSLGVGLRLIGERALGTTPEDPTAYDAVGQPVELRLSEPDSWHAWGVRVLVDLTWAL